MSDSGSGLEPSPVQNLQGQYAKVQRLYQQTLDRWTPHMLNRWLASAGLLALFLLRIVLAQGVSFLIFSILFELTRLHSGTLVGPISSANANGSFFLTPPLSMLCVTILSRYLYLHNLSFFLDAHAIYLLNLLLAFLQPKFDPSLQDDLMADEIEEGGDPAISPLPSQRDDEFRPFVRRLPEWQFW